MFSFAEIAEIKSKLGITDPIRFFNKNYLRYLNRTNKFQVPCCILEHETDVTSLVTGTDYVLGTTALVSTVFETVVRNTDEMWSSSARGKIIIRTPGVYNINAGYAITGGASSSRFLRFRKNGSIIFDQLQAQLTGFGTTFSRRFLCVVGDEFDFVVRHNDGSGNQTLTSAFFSAMLEDDIV